MDIRNLSLADVPALAELYELFWGEKSNLAKMRNQLEKLAQNPDYVLLGCFSPDNRLVGSVMGIICHELYGECTPFMVLENLIVDKNLRRFGAGKRLVQALEKQATQRGCGQIILVTEKARTDACAFYEAMGFSQDTTGYKKQIVQ